MGEINKDILRFFFIAIIFLTACSTNKKFTMTFGEGFENNRCSVKAYFLNKDENKITELVSDSILTTSDIGGYAEIFEFDMIENIKYLEINVEGEKLIVYPPKSSFKVWIETRGVPLDPNRNIVFGVRISSD